MNLNRKIGIVGDIIAADSPLMAGQGVYSSCKGDFSLIFSSLHEFSKNHDFLIGNFEAVLVDRIEKTSYSISAMKTPRSVLKELTRCKLRYLSIANNHTMEYGPDAFSWMCNQFKENNIITFGHKDTPHAVISDYLPDIKISLFAFSTVPAMYGFNPLYYYVDSRSSHEINDLIDRLKEIKKQSDYLLVFPHWGNEFIETPAPWQVTLAHRMVDSGVDAIIGAHPHVIQSACHINGKPVFYSIGNLLSDYVQERFKKNAVISMKMTATEIKFCCKIFSVNKKFEIFKTKETLPFEKNCIEHKTDDMYNNDANIIRKTVRNELILYLVRHPKRWIFNFGLWKWLILRAVFLILNAKKIKKDPNSVYSGPIH